ncbi:MAG: hypothetical protein ACD_13C00250G0002 [uncultured bacterium]|nr:MAG: hypothetical protein ACD_13C00250G0002 [uncultured bacterium]
MNNSLLSLIDSASSIIVVLPTKPYFDQVAASLSLYLSILGRKDVSIYCPSPMMVGFSRLIGVNKITQELGKKNLTIKFIGYEASNIDKVGYDIENGEFKLTVTPKAGFVSPQKDQIIMDYSGATADLLILVGGANDSHFPIMSLPDVANSKVVHVGTRVLDSKREILSFAKPGATTSELVANLIKENGLNIDPDVATNLVMGIEEGSNNFASVEVTPETFEIFAYLLRNGGQRMPRVKLSPANFPPGAIPTKPFTEAVTPVSQVESQAEIPTEEAGTESPEVNPPSDWLQPKIYKGTNVS